MHGPAHRTTVQAALQITTPNLLCKGGETEAPRQEIYGMPSKHPQANQEGRCVTTTTGQGPQQRYIPGTQAFPRAVWQSLSRQLWMMETGLKAALNSQMPQGVLSNIVCSSLFPFSDHQGTWTLAVWSRAPPII